MKKIFFIIFIISSASFPQSLQTSSPFNETTNEIYNGISESVEWCDIPILGLMVSKNIYLLRIIVSYFQLIPLNLIKK